MTSYDPGLKRFGVSLAIDLEHARRLNVEEPILFVLREALRKAKREAAKMTPGAAIGNMRVIRDTPHPGAIRCEWRWVA